MIYLLRSQYNKISLRFLESETRFIYLILIYHNIEHTKKSDKRYLHEQNKGRIKQAGTELGQAQIPTQTRLALDL